MNEQSEFERYFADQLGSAAVGTPPEAAITETIERAGGSRRLPEWLALIKESPMRTNSRIAVGSPTVRVAAILAATLMLALALAAAGAGAQRLLAAGGPIIVAADGSGDYETIQAAVDAAVDGEEILVRPGTYAEVVVIDKDVVLDGDGRREEVVLEFGEGGPTVPSWNGQVPFGLMLVDTEAVVSDLTVRGPNAAAAIVFVGGAPTLERVANDLEGDFSGRAHTSVAVLNGAGGTIRDSLLDGPVGEAINGAPMPEFEGISGSGRFVAESNVTDSGFALGITDGSAFVGNAIGEEGLIELELIGDGSVLVAENDTPSVGLIGPSDGVTIQDNDIRGSDESIAGITLGTGAAVVEGNRITGAAIGILVPAGGSPTIEGNRLEGLGTGIGAAEAEHDAVIKDNWFCGNGQDLVVQGSAVALDPSNEFCEDDATT